MYNLYDAIRDGLHFNKFVVGEQIFVEYSCPLEINNAAVWNHSDLMVHVLSGKKTWVTSSGEWSASAGETLYVKKGAAIVHQHFEEDFCMLGFLISDDFIRHAMKDSCGAININSTDESDNPIIKLDNDIILDAYFQSLLPYFSGKEAPTDTLLELKLKELIINILTSDTNPALCGYFQSLLSTNKPAISQILEENFHYNLSLEDYARMCHRSLSSFKRDFKKHFNTSPGKWLMGRRLDYAAILLKNSDHNITEIVFQSGFDDSSHFSRSFKRRFGSSPSQFRKEIQAK